MYYDKTYRGEIVPQTYENLKGKKHLRYKNGRLGGRDPVMTRVYTTPLPKGLHKECPEQRYFEVYTSDLSGRLDHILKELAKAGATHQQLEDAYHQYKKGN